MIGPGQGAASSDAPGNALYSNQTISGMCDRINLPRTITDRANALFKKVHDGKNIKTESGQATAVKTEPMTATKSFQCHICAKTFLDKRSLDRHIQIHEGIKPGKQHGCLLCGQKFIESKDLILHMESAHKTSSTNKGKYFRNFFKSRISLS